MNMIKKLRILALALAATFMAACNEDVVPSQVEAPAVEVNKDLGGFILDSVNAETNTVYVSPSKNGNDTLVFKGFDVALDIPEGSKVYLANTTDTEDPDVVNWDVLIKDGVKVSMKDTASVAVVVLDEKNRPVAIWQIVNTAAKATNSADKELSSSSGKGSASSSASDGDDVTGNSSLSTGSDEIASSSDSEVEKQKVALATLRAVYNDEEIEPVVTDHKVYFELPYGADLTQVKLNSEDGEVDLTRTVVMNFKNEDGVEEEYSVVAGVQLPGSDFSKRVDSFWGTTADVMSQTDQVVHGINDYKFKAKQSNFEETGTSIAISSELIVAAANTYLAGYVDGGWKLTGGFYYAGSFQGTKLHQLYDFDYANETGAPSPSEEVDVSQLMSFGKPFAARPVSFDVAYSYVHEETENENVPQEALIYVLLVSSDKKIVASGVITEKTSVENKKIEIQLKYGSDSGVLDAGYPVASDLTTGKGNEDVASIHVMFASSAYGHISAGGALGNDAKYYGGEGSQLILDDFKLNY